MSKLVEKVDIAVFLPSLSGGGAERVMLKLAKEFYGRNFSVDLVLCEKKGEYIHQIPPGLNVEVLNCTRVSKAIVPLSKYLKSRRPQVLLATQNHSNCVAILSKAIAFVSTKIVIREANTLSRNMGKHGNFFDRNILLFIKYLYPMSNSIIAVSEGVAKDLVNKTGLRKPIHIIYNPVVDINTQNEALKECEHPWIRDKKYPVLLAVGRLTLQKDFESLIKAVELLKPKIDVRLIILGEGELRDKLEDLIKQRGLQDRIDLPGFANNPFSYMQRSDLFVLSSLWEGLPNVLIQALSLGCRVVATNCPSGPEEILEGGRYGQLVNCGSPYDLKDAIYVALQQKRTSDDIARVQEYCQNKFGTEHIVDQYLSICGLKNAAKKSSDIS